jgi:hypothetical protein
VRCLRSGIFPLVKVRVSWDKCRYRAAYKLVRLGEKYGAKIELGALLEQLTGHCPRWANDLAARKFRRGLEFTELNSGRPPHLPAPRLKVVR